MHVREAYTETTFLNKRKKVQKPRKMTYLDIYYPIKIKSPKESLYFLLFKNESTEFQTVYFLHHKSEFPDKFKKYEALAIKQTGNKERTSQTDNRKEYLSKYC